MLDDKGKVLSLDDRNAEILRNINETLENQKLKKAQNMTLSKPLPLKFGAVITNKLLELFRGYGLRDTKLMGDIDANDLKDYYLHFMNLINTISEDIEITPTKPLFCAYMGITVKIFNSLAKSQDEGVRYWLDAINGDFTHSLLDSSMNGNASEKSALVYASTKEYGQETVQNNFQATIVQKKEVEYSPQKALEEANITAKLIAEMKKNIEKEARKG